MARGRAPARRRPGGAAPPVPVAPPPPMAAPGQSGMPRPVGPLRSGFRPPPLAPWRGPLASARRRSGASPAACGGTAAPWRSPPRLAGSACRRLPRPAAPPPPPAPLRRAPAPPAGVPGAVPRRSPWVPAVAVAPLRAPWRAPCALLRLPPAPGAAPGGGAPRVGPSRVLPSLVPRSVGRLVGLRAPRLPPGPPAGLAPRFLRPSGPGVRGLECSAPAGAGVPPPAGGGRGDHMTSWASWRLRVVWPWLSRAVGRGPFRAVSKGNIPGGGIVDSTRRRKNQPFLLEISRNVVHFADCRRRRPRGTIVSRNRGSGAT